MVGMQTYVLTLPGHGAGAHQVFIRIYLSCHMAALGQGKRVNKLVRALT